MRRRIERAGSVTEHERFVAEEVRDRRHIATSDCVDLLRIVPADAVPAHLGKHAPARK